MRTVDAVMRNQDTNVTAAAIRISKYVPQDMSMSVDATAVNAAA